MCGIVGYTGKKSALPFLLDGLEQLEYRGYDSAGVAVVGEGGAAVVRSVGATKELRERIGDRERPGEDLKKERERGVRIFYARGWGVDVSCRWL